ncbi:MAG TPA: carboxypeptidase regulatory-like domain-containing protein [Vicinamibacterales bacterium]|nr:carboxypeptidase regulatory-like domain-containing protein [Vicinamibacterales bacterium]
MIPTSGRWTCRIAIFLVTSTLGLAATAAAQGEASASVVGIVTDAQGGVLPGVTVTLRNIESGAVRTTATEAGGRYRLAGLQPGRYALRAELDGFQPTDVANLTLTIGLALQQNLTLALRGVQEAITVTAQAPVVETTTTAVATVVTQDQIEMLPIANRQAGSLALLLPGTQLPTGTRRARPTVGAGGANPNLTTSYVDGGQNQIYNSGQEFLEVPQSGIREFRVNISGSSAQYSSVGGVVLTATKSGTNQFHGEAFEFFRDTSLNAMSRFEKEAHDTRGTPKPEYRRNQNGGTVGGPVVQNRLHFFTAFERTKEPKTVTVRTGQPQFYSAVEGNLPAGYERRQLLLRGDLQISNTHNLFVRYLWDKEYTFCEECGGAMAGNTGTDTDSPRDSLLVAHTWVISPRVLNEVRSQLPPSHLENLGSPPGIARWPASGRGEFPAERFKEYTGVYIFPSLTWGSTGYSNNNTARWDMSDDLTVSAGDHTLKGGGAFLRFRSNEESAHNIATWTFGQDQFFDGSAAAIRNLRNPIQFTASFPPLPRHLQADWIQSYVQDEWKVLSNLTLDIGLRYENLYRAFNNHITFDGRERLRELINPSSRHDNNNWGPRFGFAWDVRGDNRTVLRLATGKYYGNVFAGTLRNEVNTLLQSSVNIRNPSYPDPYGGLSPQAFVSGSATPNVAITSDSIEQPESKALNLGLSRELQPSLAVHVDVVYSNGTKASQIANVNTPDPVTGIRPRPTWGNVSEYRSEGDSDYRAMYLRLDKRLSNRYQYLVSYTLAHDKDRDAGQATVVDFYHPEYDQGWGSQDRRHTLVASGAIILPMDVTLGAVWNYRSTRPFSAVAGTDLNRDGAVTDYVPGTTRTVFDRGDNAKYLALVNAWRAQNGRTPISEDQLMTDEFKRVDVRISKQIRVGGDRRAEVIAQIFNMFGNDSFGIGATPWQMNALSNSFGTINTVYPRQQAELAVRFVW